MMQCMQATLDYQVASFGSNCAFLVGVAKPANFFIHWMEGIPNGVGSSGSNESNPWGRTMHGFTPCRQQSQTSQAHGNCSIPHSSKHPDCSSDHTCIEATHTLPSWHSAALTTRSLFWEPLCIPLNPASSPPPMHWKEEPPPPPPPPCIGRKSPPPPPPPPPCIGRKKPQTGCEITMIVESVGHLETACHIIQNTMQQRVAWGHLGATIHS